MWSGQKTKGERNHGERGEHNQAHAINDNGRVLPLGNDIVQIILPPQAVGDEAQLLHDQMEVVLGVVHTGPSVRATATTARTGLGQGELLHDGRIGPREVHLGLFLEQCEQVSLVGGHITATASVVTIGSDVDNGWRESGGISVRIVVHDHVIRPLLVLVVGHWMAIAR